MTQGIALAETLATRAAERRMIGDRVLDTELAEAPVRARLTCTSPQSLRSERIANT
jgi:hypothetical protein